MLLMFIQHCFDAMLCHCRFIWFEESHVPPMFITVNGTNHLFNAHYCIQVDAVHAQDLTAKIILQLYRLVRNQFLEFYCKPDDSVGCSLQKQSAVAIPAASPTSALGVVA
jgi:hypothetical protein